jgi:predicted nucleotidyltransferase component of viral defense system
LKKVIEDREVDSKIREINKTDNSTKIVLSYTSVLEHKNSIILDVSKREKPVMELITKKMKSPYFEEIEILTFHLEELVAEKIRALVQRNKPRDFLDLYYT